MLQKTGEPNPHNFFGTRRTKKCLPHFKIIEIKFDYSVEEKVSRWIYTNLKSRFFIGKVLVNTEEKRAEYAIRIGFEDPKEITIFSLSCPHILRS